MNVGNKQIKCLMHYDSDRVNKPKLASKLPIIDDSASFALVAFYSVFNIIIMCGPW